MSEEDKILPEEIPPEQPANKDSSDEIISSAEPVTEAEQPQTTNLSSEALPAGQAGLAKEDDQPLQLSSGLTGTRWAREFKLNSGITKQIDFCSAIIGRAVYPLRKFPFSLECLHDPPILAGDDSRCVSTIGSRSSVPRS